MAVPMQGIYTMALVDPATGTPYAAGAAADGGAGGGLPAAAQNQLFNGTTWDRQRSNVPGALLAGAARTVTTVSPDQTNFNARTLKVVLDVSAIGTGSITVTVQGKDNLSGNYYPLLTGAAVVANGTTAYDVGPGIPNVAAVSAGVVVPRYYRVQVVANNANPVTYSVSNEQGV